MLETQGKPVLTYLLLRTTHSDMSIRGVRDQREDCSGQRVSQRYGGDQGRLGEDLGIARYSGSEL